MEISTLLFKDSKSLSSWCKPETMRALMPISLLFLVATAVVYALQAIPVLGIYLMFLMAPFWSVVLVNVAMTGIAAEALVGRVSRWWLMLPLTFYAGYWVVAAQEHLALNALTASFDKANARVATGFDPSRHALVFAAGESGAWLTQNYALPVSYTVNSNFPEGHISSRMMERAVCHKVRESATLRAAFVHAVGFHDGDAMIGRRLEKNFCTISMPERPELPPAQVIQQKENVVEGLMPITRVTSTIIMPDGNRFQLLGGVAAPLSWMPMPVVGCALNSGQARWVCQATFWRKRYTPIVSGDTRYNRDNAVMARALGLQPVAITRRQGGDPNLVLAKIAAVEDATLARQLANIDAMITNPAATVKDWNVGAVKTHPDALATRADTIMTGLERAAEISGNERYRARESGRILARLVAALSQDRFLEFGPRILALFERADDKHWLWETEPLLRRMGELGTRALPYLTNPKTSARSVNGAGIEGLCRVGSAGRADAEQALVAMWNASRDGMDRNARAAMFVAMRRMGITPPPLADDKHKQLLALETEWADITPQSPSHVCAIRAERLARRQQKSSSARGTNVQ